MLKREKEVERVFFGLVCLAFFIVFCPFSSSATSGNVQYFWNLTNTSNSVDYLVIAHEDFYNNTDLYNLALWRAENNSFDVGIVNTSNIYAQFNDTPTSANDTNLKNFIAFVV